MAAGPIPYVLRIGGLPLHLRAALALLLDMAREREDGTYVARVTDVTLAAAAAIPVKTAGNIRRQLMVAGYLVKTARQSEWIVCSPSGRAINDAVQQRWSNLNHGNPAGAPIVSPKWTMRRRSKPVENVPDYGRFRVAKRPELRTFSQGKNIPKPGKENPEIGMFSAAPYIGVYKDTEQLDAFDNPERGATVDAHQNRPRDTQSGGWLAEKGLPDAAQQETAPANDTPTPKQTPSPTRAGASDPDGHAPETAGMIG